MKRTAYAWVLEILTLLSLIWCFYPFCFYDEFSDPIPIHYNAMGQVDSWGDRSFFWLLPLLSLFFYVGMSILEKYHSKLNYPIKVTKENANLLYKLALGLLRHIKFITILIFAYINNATMYIALFDRDGLNGYILTGLLLCLILILLSYIIRMMKINNK